MKSGKRPRPLLLFYILVGYVLLQFGWWAFLLVRLNNHVSELRRELIEVKISAEPAIEDTASLVKDEALLADDLHKQWLMIFGEGFVFLLLLLLGIYRTRNSFKKEAALAARQKNFLLSVTHELRSPLASIRLQLETVARRDLPKEKQQEMHASALEDIDRLNALVENILVAARIDNHTYSVFPEKGDLSAVVTELSDKAAAGVARQHRLTKQVTQGISVPFDRIGFHSIFMNLVENAVKYSRPGTDIVVTLARRNETILLSVADSGTGVPDAEKANIFERFYRLGNEETRSTKGTGLGLYIVKHLADAHGWSIRLNDRPGGGSSFEITITQS
jgi:signal transduction histidine kinase